MILAIHEEIRSQAREDRHVRYDNPDGRAPSLVRLEAMLDAVPLADVVTQAAWIMRTLILLQPFPDGNHRTAMLAAGWILKRSGFRFRPSPDDAAAFQETVSGARFKRLGGYDDAPLSVVGDWHDEVFDCCLKFIEGSLSQEG